MVFVYPNISKHRSSTVTIQMKDKNGTRVQSAYHEWSLKDWKLLWGSSEGGRECGVSVKAQGTAVPAWRLHTHSALRLCYIYKTIQD